MKLADLSEATRQKIAKVRWDRIVGRHESPWDWHCLIDDESEPFIFPIVPIIHRLLGTSTTFQSF